MGIRSYKPKKKLKLAEKINKINVLIEEWAKCIIDPIAQNDPEAPTAASEKEKLHTRLQNPGPGGKPNVLDTYATPPPNGYYVIVGCGAAAIVNHTTLRQSEQGRARLGDLPVMHIGLPDPWLTYRKHGMGQPPYLLGLPGYHQPAPPDSPAFDYSCNSKVFAGSTEQEWEALEEAFETYRVHGFVGAIESRAQRASSDLKEALVDLGVPRGELHKVLKLDFPKKDLPFRLLVVLPKIDGEVVSASLHLVYAYKIDLCSGAGRLRIKTRAFETTKDAALPAPFNLARTPPWLAPDKWTKTIKDRLVIEGMDGLTELTPTRPRICVVGSGGIGLNQMERANNDKGVCLDWVASNYMVDNATFALRRNDTVLKMFGPVDDANLDEAFMTPGGADAVRKDPAVRAQPPVRGRPATVDTPEVLPQPAREAVYHPGEGVNFELIPGSKKMRLAQHATLDIANVAVQGSKIEVKFRQTAAKTAFISDFFERSLHLTSAYFPFSDLFGPAHRACCGQSSYQSGQLYDRLVLCLGQDQNLTGEPVTIADGFEFTPMINESKAVGLKNKAGAGANEADIRIMGSAAAMFPPTKISPTAGGDSYKRMEDYRKTLPVSSVPPGFILNCCNIATANGFFADGKPNDNANTAPQSELQTLLLAKGLAAAERIATLIVAGRSAPNDGFPNMDELIKRLQTANPTASTDWGGDWQDKIRAALKTSYRAADPWGEEDDS